MRNPQVLAPRGSARRAAAVEFAALLVVAESYYSENRHRRLERHAPSFLTSSTSRSKRTRGSPTSLAHAAHPRATCAAGPRQQRERTLGAPWLPVSLITPGQSEWDSHHTCWGEIFDAESRSWSLGAGFLPCLQPCGRFALKRLTLLSRCLRVRFDMLNELGG